MVAFTSAKFTAEQAAAYDKMMEEKGLAAGKSTHENAAKKLQKEVLEAFGDHSIAVLPDGRKLQRIQEERQVAASEGRTDKWWKIIKLD